jgi:hypothetical protein
MTTLEGRPHTAVLVVDVQTGVVEGAHERDASGPPCTAPSSGATTPPS